MFCYQNQFIFYNVPHCVENYTMYIAENYASGKI